MGEKEHDAASATHNHTTTTGPPFPGLARLHYGSRPSRSSFVHLRGCQCDCRRRRRVAWTGWTGLDRVGQGPWLAYREHYPAAKEGRALGRLGTFLLGKIWQRWVALETDCMLSRNKNASPTTPTPITHHPNHPRSATASSGRWSTSVSGMDVLHLPLCPPLGPARTFLLEKIKWSNLAGPWRHSLPLSPT